MATQPTKSTNPFDRMGVYKRLDEVPSRYRLYHFADQYSDRDVWNEFLTDYLFEHYSSKRFQEDARRAGRYWKEHMADRGRHHALARPTDVEVWIASLLEDRNRKTTYNSYWVRLERFYSWLQWHTDHPHRYHPCLMAAGTYPASHAIWQEKIQRGRESTSTKPTEEADP